LSVYLSAGEFNKYERILMNFCRRAGHGQRRQRSDFGGDLDYFVDSGSLITIRRWSVNGDLAVISAGARSAECSLLSVLKLHAKILKSFTAMT